MTCLGAITEFENQISLWSELLANLRGCLLGGYLELDNLEPAIEGWKIS